MSKSEGENPASYILLTDSDDDILRKCKKAVTDSDGEVRFDPENKPGVSNLLSIYALCAGKTIPDAERDFAGKGYGALKPAVGEAVCQRLAPVRAKIAAYLDDPAELARLMAAGAADAAALAAPVLRRVKNAVGFVSAGAPKP